MFKTDGTDAGTTKVKDLNGFGVIPGRYHARYHKPNVFIAAGTKAYFLATATATGQEVWVTDGTEAGTHMVADMYPGCGPDLYGTPILVGLIGTDLIFAESTSETNWQVFRTDGTSAGTSALTNFPALSYGYVGESIVANGKIYMSVGLQRACCSLLSGLWVTDGTTAGTHEMTDSGSPPSHLRPSSMTVFGNSVLFLADVGGLYKIDTASEAVQWIAGAQYNTSTLSSMPVMNGYVLFAGSDDELWRTDGTAGGTALVKAIGNGTGASGSLGTADARITKVGNHAVFRADDGQHGFYLWSSDGTAQGTVPLIAAAAQPGLTYLDSLLGVAGTHAYYAFYTGTDYRIVVTDGTVAGTHLLSDIGGFRDAVIDDTEAVGDDALTFIRTVQELPTGTVKRLFNYSPQSNTLTLLRESPYYNNLDVASVLDNGHGGYLPTNLWALNGALYFFTYDMPATGSSCGLQTREPFPRRSHSSRRHFG